MQVSQVVFQEASARTPRVVPDLISAYFDMVYRYILFCAERLVSHPTFPTTMQLAVACLNLTEKEPLRFPPTFLPVRYGELEMTARATVLRSVESAFDHDRPALQGGVYFPRASNQPPEPAVGEPRAGLGRRQRSRHCAGEHPPFSKLPGLIPARVPHFSVRRVASLCVPSPSSCAELL